MKLPLILASTSPYRQMLLQRLGLPFSVCAPEVDETRRTSESPRQMVMRLAEAKARAGADKTGPGLVIGSDQVAVLDERTILGKPGTTAKAHDQLRSLSGHTVSFLTGLCLYNSQFGRIQVDVVPYRVHFRQLTGQQIDNYIAREQPLDCAGSFKSEGLGISLFEWMEGEDPNALIGLPLIRLVRMLAQEGIDVLSEAPLN